MRIAIAVFAAALLGGCVSATDCMTSIPEEIRADTMRYVLDQQLVDRALLPKEAISLGFEKGTPFRDLTDDRQRELAPYAVGYATCIRERVSR
jgi:hypothetical protein